MFSSMYFLWYTWAIAHRTAKSPLTHPRAMIRHGFYRADKRVGFMHKYPSTHELYGRWVGMKSRCLNPHRRSFKQYGARGIKVEWKTFDEFVDDMYSSFIVHKAKNGGGRKTQIERKNTDGNYSKDNCIWATPKENCRNKRNNRILEHNGEKKPMMYFAEKYKIEFDLLDWRLKHGWSIQKSLTTPIRRHRGSRRQKKDRQASRSTK